MANERPESAFERLAAERAPIGEDVLDLARKGDEVSVKVLQEARIWLAIGLATFVNIFDSEVSAVGGVSRRQEIWYWSLPAGSYACGHLAFEGFGRDKGGHARDQIRDVGCRRARPRRERRVRAGRLRNTLGTVARKARREEMRRRAGKT